MFNIFRTSNILCIDSYFGFLAEEDYKEILIPDEERIAEVMNFVKQFKILYDYDRIKTYDLKYILEKFKLGRVNIFLNKAIVERIFL